VAMALVMREHTADIVAVVVVDNNLDNIVVAVVVVVVVEMDTDNIPIDYFVWVRLE
jgi:hypothetical protein